MISFARGKNKRRDWERGVHPSSSNEKKQKKRARTHGGSLIEIPNLGKMEGPQGGRKGGDKKPTIRGKK